MNLRPFGALATLTSAVRLRFRLRAYGFKVTHSGFQPLNVGLAFAEGVRIVNCPGKIIQDLVSSGGLGRRKYPGPGIAKAIPLFKLSKTCTDSEGPYNSTANLGDG